ncbi:hypothetical protein ABFA07_009281 [Porites harrisoni]
MRLSALCAVLSLLVVFFLIPEVTSCYVKVNGCSIPGDLSFFYKTKFRLACDKHDVCYYCGRHYGWQRIQCDDAFWKDMLINCSFWDFPCKMAAEVYYGSVRVGGAFFFNSPTKKWCRAGCAKRYGNPNTVIRR